MSCMAGVFAKDCKAEGRGLSRAVAGEDAQFEVKSFGAAGKPRAIASYANNLKALVEYTSGADVGTRLPSNLSEDKPGIYAVAYCGKLAGTTRISVTVRGEHIPGSPFSAEVVAGAMMIWFDGNGFGCGCRLSLRVAGG